LPAGTPTSPRARGEAYARRAGREIPSFCIRERKFFKVYGLGDVYSPKEARVTMETAGCFECDRS
jgi:hypothetical protein